MSNYPHPEDHPEWDCPARRWDLPFNALVRFGKDTPLQMCNLCGSDVPMEEDTHAIWIGHVVVRGGFHDVFRPLGRVLQCPACNSIIHTIYIYCELYSRLNGMEQPIEEFFGLDRGDEKGRPGEGRGG